MIEALTILSVANMTLQDRRKLFTLLACFITQIITQILGTILLWKVTNSYIFVNLKDLGVDFTCHIFLLCYMHNVNALMWNNFASKEIAKFATNYMAVVVAEAVIDYADIYVAYKYIYEVNIILVAYFLNKYKYKYGSTQLSLAELS